MFRTKYFLAKIKEITSRRRFNKKKIFLNGVAALILLVIFWLVAALSGLRTFVPHFLTLTGFPFTERNYLIIFQNNAEMRPTGGFISAYGLLKFKNGLYAGLEFHDVYGEIDDHDYITPPYPMEELLMDKGYQGYTFRDANWQPDFRTSAEELIDFYHFTFPETEIAGVIAIDFKVLEDLVSLFEPLEVRGLRLTSDNLFEQIENFVSDIDRHNEEILLSRKDIMEDFNKILIKKMLGSPLEFRAVSDVLVRNLDQKHLLFYFKNRALAEKMRERNWDGAMPEPAARDFLSVIEANLGGMKSDRYFTREVHYQIEITDDYDENKNRLIYADLEIKISHLGEENIPLSGLYTGYFRTFGTGETPHFLEIEAPSYEDLGYEKTHRTFEITDAQTGQINYLGWGDLLVLKPGETAALRYRYQLPPSVLKDDAYHLYLRKQPGTEADFYQVVVKTPQGTTVWSNQFRTQENLGIFQGNLDQDWDLKLKILPDELGPRLYSHEITALNEITLVFNEYLDSQSADDPLAYQIIDLNYQEASLTDQIYLDQIEVQGKAVILKTVGMMEQPDERYQVTFQNIRDRHGNYINPNPRSVTVIQRFD